MTQQTGPGGDWDRSWRRTSARFLGWYQCLHAMTLRVTVGDRGENDCCSGQTWLCIGLGRGRVYMLLDRIPSGLLAESQLVARRLGRKVGTMEMVGKLRCSRSLNRRTLPREQFRGWTHIVVNAKDPAHGRVNLQKHVIKSECQNLILECANGYILHVCQIFRDACDFYSQH